MEIPIDVDAVHVLCASGRSVDGGQRKRHAACEQFPKWDILPSLTTSFPPTFHRAGIAIPCMYRTFGKRLFDVALGGFAFAICLPVMLVVAASIRTMLGKPCLFRQRRSGIHGAPFEIIKFRTMTNASDAQGQPLHDAERLGRFGMFLRRTSLDELPELVNVLRGEMSLVGPRPLRDRYLDRYSLDQRRRLDIRPGITGWAQIHGRNNVSWHDRFKLDCWYVDHYSFFFDLRIIAVTLWKVIRQDHVSKEGHVSMEEFMGDKHD